jgi:cytochrome P450
MNVATVSQGKRAPGPRGLPVLGNLLDVWRDTLELFVDAHRAHGDFVQFRFLNLDYLLVADADAAHHVLVSAAKNYRKSRSYDGLRLVFGNGLLTSEGELWRRQRKLAQPAFHKERLAGFARAMVDATDAMLARWAARSEPEAPLDAHAEMMRVTFQIVGQTLFSVDVDGDAEAVGRALSIALEHADAAAQAVVQIPPWMPTPQNVRFKRAMATLDEVVYRIVAERRRTKAVHHDLLAMFMEARDEDEGEGGTGMTDRQLRDELMTMVLAGHETTANALTWTWYLLAQHPEIEARVVAEVDAVLGRRRPTLDDVPRLALTGRVLQEAMRLYPPAWMVERQANAPDTLGDVLVPRDGVVGVCTYLLHRNPKYFPDPERFDPDRFLPERAASRPKYAYMPFGGGPRICIGHAFATMEAQLILARVLQSYRLTLGQKHTPKLEPMITLRPKGGLAMRIRPRASPAPMPSG